jgi:hypothetical protein
VFYLEDIPAGISDISVYLSWGYLQRYLRNIGVLSWGCYSIYVRNNRCIISRVSQQISMKYRCIYLEGMSTDISEISINIHESTWCHAPECIWSFLHFIASPQRAMWTHHTFVVSTASFSSPSHY